MFRRNLHNLSTSKMYRKEFLDTFKSKDFIAVYPLVAVMGIAGCIVSYYTYHQITCAPDVYLSYNKRKEAMKQECGLISTEEDGIKAQNKIENTYNTFNYIKKCWPWNLVYKP